MDLCFSVIHNHFIGYTNILEHVGQGVVCFTFLWHGVCPNPMEISAIDLSISVLSSGQNICFHSVCEDSMRDPVVSQHPVIGFEAPRQSRVRDEPDSPLGCHSYSVLQLA